MKKVLNGLEVIQMINKATFDYNTEASASMEKINKEYSVANLVATGMSQAKECRLSNDSSYITFAMANGNKMEILRKESNSYVVAFRNKTKDDERNVALTEDSDEKLTVLLSDLFESLIEDRKLQEELKEQATEVAFYTSFFN